MLFVYRFHPCLLSHQVEGLCDHQYLSPARRRFQSRSRFNPTQGGFECIPRGAVERSRANASVERQTGWRDGFTGVSRKILLAILGFTSVHRFELCVCAWRPSTTAVAKRTQDPFSKAHEKRLR